MQVLNIINQVGPLPIAAKFTAPLDGPALLVATGSLWSQTSNVLLQMSVQLGSARLLPRSRPLVMAQVGGRHRPGRSILGEVCRG